MSTQSHIAFLGTSRSGLGHLRRIANIAWHMARAVPDLRLTLISNDQPAGLSPCDLAPFSQIMVCDRSDMSSLLAKSAVSLAVCDTLKLPGIAAYGGQAALVLRETPQANLEGFRREDRRPWDCVIVPNAAAHWMPAVDAGFARRIEAAGWILRPTGMREPTERSAGIVLASGGGGTPETRAMLYPMLERVIARAKGLCAKGFHLRQALGPRAGGEVLCSVDEVFDPAGTLNAVFRAADLVISTAGYHSVLELASTDTPALLVPIPRSLDDQTARVRLWGPQIGYGLLPNSEDHAATWLADQINRPRRRAPVDLGPDGGRRAAEILLDMPCPVL